MTDDRKNIYLTLHKSFCREGIGYTDRQTGEERTFNSVTLPKGTSIDGQDVSYYQFSPMFVNPSKYKGENYRDIPLLANREVWLQRSVLDAEGNPLIGEDGKRVRETLKVMPDKLKEAVDTARREYLEEHLKGRDERPLSERASKAREGSAALADHDIPFENRGNRGR